jgi:hypothetical protein
MPRPDERHAAREVEGRAVAAGLRALRDHEVDAPVRHANGLLDRRHGRADDRTLPDEPRRVTEREREHRHTGGQAELYLLIDGDLVHLELAGARWQIELRPQRVDARLHGLDIPA